MSASDNRAGEERPSTRLDAARPGDRSAEVAAVYQELILDHYRRPRNRGALASPDATATIRNPLCGDAIRLQLAYDGGGARVARAAFVGEGCSISLASASMMTGLVAGKTREEVAALKARFAELLKGDADAARDPALGELRALSGVARIPARVPCAMLPWEALERAMKGGG